MSESLTPGVHEALVTKRLAGKLSALDYRLIPDVADLRDAEASDRLSRHVAMLLARAIEAQPEGQRATRGLAFVRSVLENLERSVGEPSDLSSDTPLEPGQVLQAVQRQLPDGRPKEIERPLTPLLDTTLLTNAPGEPALSHEVRTEVDSADTIDVVMAFIRFSGIRPLLDVLRRHCAAGKTLRVLTTVYTGSTEQRALDELASLGAQIKVSYDTTSTRLHAKAWLFHRESGYTTAYLGSSNLTHSAQVTGLEWNVRISGIRNPDVVAKMAAVFGSYWISAEFVDYEPGEFARRTAVSAPLGGLVSPVAIELKPFQDALLEQLALARFHDQHRNLLVAATGTGKTVMAAVDYSRLRRTLRRDRLLFVAHREEILEQSLRTFRHAVQDSAFGELWVGTHKPSRFEHVFASIQTLTANRLSNVDPDWFDIVIVDEFHHAAAPSYTALLNHLQPVELLGLTATPERSDDLDVLRWFGGAISAELRLWDAIDAEYLAPFAYFGIHDGVDLTQIPWKRGRGYDVDALTNVYTADDVWSNRVIEQLQRNIGNPAQMRALGFCASIGHARFMADRFARAGLPAVAVWGDSPAADRAGALRDLADGKITTVFTVDLFNEGVDVPAVDTLLLMRPTESPTLFLQQLGRGLRKAQGKTVCTVLDFIGMHHKEFRFDRRLRALLGGSRRDVVNQVKGGFPFLPSGCTMELDAVAQDVVLDSLRRALPTGWRDQMRELRQLGAVSLATFLKETGIELEDLYSGNHSWSALCRAAGLSTAQAGPDEDAMLRAIGRLLHVDDDQRLAAYQAIVESDQLPSAEAVSDRDARLLRMLIASMTTLRRSASLDEGIKQLWHHPQVRAELAELLRLLPSRIRHIGFPLGLQDDIPLRVHARYTRIEILSAFGVDEGMVAPPTWQTGVWWEKQSRTDLFAITLDKTGGGFSPTTRYRDYAMSPDLIHWESQSNTSVDSDTGRRYLAQATSDTNVCLFARIRDDDRAFWCLGPATLVGHSGDRPIAITWKLQHRLPAELYTSFAAAVA